MRIARHLLISGRVQGVWYRDWMVGEARGRGLAGWVRNLGDGRVEAVAEAVDAMIAACREGSSQAEVEEVAVSEAAPEGGGRFSRRG